MITNSYHIMSYIHIHPHICDAGFLVLKIEEI